jgi:hypothetical protein
MAKVGETLADRMLPSCLEDPHRVKRCWRCQRVKLIEMFYRRAKSVDGRQAICRTCDAERSSAGAAR